MGIKLGFIGLGIMGKPVAPRNDLSSELLVADLTGTREKTGRECEIIITLGPKGKKVQDISLFSPVRVPARLKSGSLAQVSGYRQRLTGYRAFSFSQQKSS